MNLPQSEIEKHYHRDKGDFTTVTVTFSKQNMQAVSTVDRQFGLLKSTNSLAFVLSSKTG